MAATDIHPSNSILTVGSEFGAVLLPSNTRTPTQYTVTLTAAVAQNATSISVTVTGGTPVVYANTQLVFGGTTLVTTTDTPISGTTTIAILPAPAAVSSGTATTTFLWGNLLGVQEMSEDSKSSLISIRSLASGKYNDQRVTMNDNSLQFSGWYHQKDSCMANVIKVSYRNASEIYFQAEYTDGENVRGIGVISSLTRAAKLDDVQKYTFTLNINGTPIWSNTVAN